MKPKNLVIVRAVREQGLTHAEAAARFGVTRQWVHTLVTRYDADGVDGVAPRSRAPRPRPGTISDLQILLTDFQTWYNTQRLNIRFSERHEYCG